MPIQHRNQIIKILTQKITKVKEESKLLRYDFYLQGKQEGLEIALKIIKNMK